MTNSFRARTRRDHGHSQLEQHKRLLATLLGTTSPTTSTPQSHDFSDDVKPASKSNKVDSTASDQDRRLLGPILGGGNTNGEQSASGSASSSDSSDDTLVDDGSPTTTTDDPSSEDGKDGSTSSSSSSSSDPKAEDGDGDIAPITDPILDPIIGGGPVSGNDTSTSPDPIITPIPQPSQGDGDSSGDDGTLSPPRNDTGSDDGNRDSFPWDPQPLPDPGNDDDKGNGTSTGDGGNKNGTSTDPTKGSGSTPLPPSNSTETDPKKDSGSTERPGGNNTTDSGGKGTQTLGGPPASNTTTSNGTLLGNITGILGGGTNTSSTAPTATPTNVTLTPLPGSTTTVTNSSAPSATNGTLAASADQHSNNNGNVGEIIGIIAGSLAGIVIVAWLISIPVRHFQKRNRRMTFMDFGPHNNHQFPDDHPISSAEAVLGRNRSSGGGGKGGYSLDRSFSGTRSRQPLEDADHQYEPNPGYEMSQIPHGAPQIGTPYGMTPGAVAPGGAAYPYANLDGGYDPEHAAWYPPGLAPGGQPPLTVMYDQQAYDTDAAYGGYWPGSPPAHAAGGGMPGTPLTPPVAPVAVRPGQAHPHPEVIRSGGSSSGSDHGGQDVHLLRMPSSTQHSSSAYSDVPAYSPGGGAAGHGRDESVALASEKLGNLRVANLNEGDKAEE